jgi:plasmid stabilization system protein ParE
MEIVIGLLAEHPLLGRRTDDPTIRRLTVPSYPYLVFYEIREDEIVVHALRHAARDPDSMPGGDG